MWILELRKLIRVILCLLFAKCLVQNLQSIDLFYNYFRPMYCDNVDYHDPSGVQTVGRMLRDNLEPLLMVCIHYYGFNYVSYDI